MGIVSIEFQLLLREFSHQLHLLDAIYLCPNLFSLNCQCLFLLLISALNSVFFQRPDMESSNRLPASSVSPA